MTRRPSPTRRVCEDCGGHYFNLAAHLEECPGRLEFAGYYRCDRCGQEGRRQGHFCSCGGDRVKVMQPPPNWRRGGGAA